jgi:hypothetical protein
MYAMQASKDGTKVAAAGFDMNKGYTNDIIQISVNPLALFVLFCFVLFFFDNIKIWDIKTGKTTGAIHVAQESCCIAFSYDGNILYFINSSAGNVSVSNR